MRRIALLIAAFALAGPLLGQAVLDGKWWKRPRVAAELKLSSQQSAELEKIFARTRPKLIDLRADLEKKQFDYEQAMQSETTDRKAIDAKIEAREQARARLQKELTAMELDMKQVLSPEQREKLMQLRDEARRIMQERRRRLRDGEPEDRPPKRQKP